MNPIDRAQLQRFDRYWRAVLAGDDPIRVRALAAAGLLEAFKPVSYTHLQVSILDDSFK